MKHVFGAMSEHDARLIGVSIRLGHRFVAIRELRDATGWSLVRAKDFINMYLPDIADRYDSKGVSDFDYKDARRRFLDDNFMTEFIEPEEMMI